MTQGSKYVKEKREKKMVTFIQHTHENVLSIYMFFFIGGNEGSKQVARSIKV